MSKLFDDVSRILGSPLPRRQAVRLIVGGLAGGYLARWPGKAMAAGSDGAGSLAADESFLSITAPFSSPQPGFCESGGEYCRTGTRGEFCCAPSFTCCYPDTYRALCCLEGTEVCCEPIGAPKQKRCCNTNENCCCIRRGIRRCRPKAGSVITSVLPGQIGMRLFDPAEDGGGITRIRVLRAENVTVDIPDFAPGSRQVDLQAVKIDAGKPARLVVETFEDCTPDYQCPSDSEALLAELQVADNGVSAAQTFTNVGRGQSFVQVQNGRPGASRVQVMVNGTKAWALRLGEDEIRGVDVGAAMRPEGNTVTLLVSGAPGAAALVTLNPARHAAELPRVQWIPGSASPGMRSLWGDVSRPRL